MTSGEAHGGPAEALPPVRVFINYRRKDTRGEALVLYDRLVSKFGDGNVFMDLPDIEPGMTWPGEIESHIDSCQVFLALIGPEWTPIIKARRREPSTRLTEDHVQSEIRRAIRPNSGIGIIPVLIGDTSPPKGADLPGALRILAGIQAVRIRAELPQRDIDFLIGAIEEVARKEAAIPPDVVTERAGGRHITQIPAVRWGAAAPPDEAHFDEVLRHMVAVENLVPFLGSRMSVGRADGANGLEPPESKHLAFRLAKEFDIDQAGMGLPEIAQRVSATIGERDLHRKLRGLLAADCEPGPVHRFLARLPRRLEELRLEKRYQLIVSTSYDTALEQAFDDEAEPYDLAVYMAGDKGKFVHFPAEGAPKVITPPNAFYELPIDVTSDFELQRTVIVKIHGAIDGGVGDEQWKDKYAVTEDHYIDYLSEGSIEDLVPLQVLGKLRNSHCLFLGYTVRDWSLRVFLKRIWGERLGTGHWAVAPDPDVLEKKLWIGSQVELYGADLGEYVSMLDERLASRVPRSTRA